ncbi:MAG: hypothetical protein QOD39_3440, partial [Mycobacterium sp.]|nr:hypothetical protein [Mycobacterium sp.]
APQRGTYQKVWQMFQFQTGSVMWRCGVVISAA